MPAKQQQLLYISSITTAMAGKYTCEATYTNMPLNASVVLDTFGEFAYINLAALSFTCCGVGCGNLVLRHSVPYLSRHWDIACWMAEWNGKERFLFIRVIKENKHFTQAGIKPTTVVFIVTRCVIAPQQFHTRTSILTYKVNKLNFNSFSQFLWKHRANYLLLFPIWVGMI